MRKIIIMAFICLIFIEVNGKKAEKKAYSNPFINKKELKAKKITERIKIDGILNESIWNDASVANNFVTFEPTIGESASQKTTVKVLYDNNALYIGAKLHDSQADSIIKVLTQRDERRINADNFSITLNPYNDGQNVLKFMVSAANVQTDIKISSGENDDAWNAVWESEVKISDEGWFVEIKIPYAAIRFSNEKTQTWSINFWREVRRSREISSWNLVDRTFEDQGNQDGLLTNIKDIKAPFRLELYPYISGGLLYDSDGNNNSFSAGMDLKYGINESYTLDMTLIPDFGQRQSDDEILNLSAFEVHYDEKRQFFTEGTELFNKAGLFYSRRIGDEPSNYDNIEDNLAVGETIKENPIESNLINATKISGRNKNGLGLGFFNAMTSNTYATTVDSMGNEHEHLTEPFTNYNIFVIDQTFWSNSYINIINTNVYKPSTDYIANVTGTAFKLTNRKNIFGIEGRSAISSQITDSTTTGFMGDYKLGKLSGNFQYAYGLELLTNTYDPNDLGYLRRNNEFTQELEFEYKSFEPKGAFLNWNTDLEIQYSRLQTPNKFTEFSFSFSSKAVLKNYLFLGFNSHFSPVERHDYFESRVEGKVYKRPGFYYFDLFSSSDYRKTFALDLKVSYFKSNDIGYSFRLNPRIRINDKLSFNHEYRFNIEENQYGYVDNISADTILFGLRDEKTITNTFTGAYIFNNKISLSLRLRHYWSTVDYQSFYNLNSNGRLDNIDYNENEDRNYNAFNIDLLYSWNFAPGSFITFMWKNNISEELAALNDNFFDNLKNTLKSPQSNVFSIKISYYLDYKNLIKRK